MVLLNEFSWSFSRASLFTECQKRYWYTYYGSWNGWPKTPWDKRKEIDPLSARLYALKQMQSIPTYVGSCVHETIEKFLKAKQPFSLEALVADAKDAFYEGIEEAKSGKWKESPKKYTNLFEYHYGDGVRDLKTPEEKVVACLENWYQSPVVQNLAFHPDSRWLSIEELAFFQLAGKYKIIVVIDFALMWRDKAILFDWKTGEESEKTEEQLALYALFANRVWAVPFDKIVLSPFYVAKNSYTKLTVDEEKLKKVEESVVVSCDKLSVLHDTDIRDFAYTEDRTKCARCSFKEVCESVNYQNCSVDELRESLVAIN